MSLLYIYAVNPPSRTEQICLIIDFIPRS